MPDFVDDCRFCQIIKDRIESYDVYENDAALAVLDLTPVSDGHTLVMPKTHATAITDLDASTTEALFRAVQEVVTRMEDRIDADGITVLQSNGGVTGQEIHHLHVHIIPRYAGEEFDVSFTQGDLDGEGADQIVRRLQQTLME